MKEFFQSVTAAQVTFWIAVAGFLMSLFSWLKDIAVNRKRFDTRILEFHTNSSAAYMYLLISNHSRLSIAVSSVSLVCGDRMAPCTPVPKCVMDYTRRSGHEVIERRFEYSSSLPVSVAGLGGVTAIFLFEDLPQPIPADATDLTLLIGTNRGRPAKRKLSLPEGWAVRSDLP